MLAMCGALSKIRACLFSKCNWTIRRSVQSPSKCETSEGYDKNAFGAGWGGDWKVHVSGDLSHLQDAMNELLRSLHKEDESMPGVVQELER